MIKDNEIKASDIRKVHGVSRAILVNAGLLKGKTNKVYLKVDVNSAVGQFIAIYGKKGKECLTMGEAVANYKRYCANGYYKRYWEKHKEHLAQSRKKWIEKNREKLRNYYKKYCEENHEKIKQLQKRWQKRNYGKIIERNKKYREENPEAVKKWNKDNYNRHREQILKQKKEYRERLKNEKNNLNQ